MAIRKARDDIGADYYVDGILGEGGYGVVFAALHRKTGRRVAVKRVSPFEHSLLAVRTLRELRLLRFFREKTTCENIIGLLDVVIPGECASFQEVYLVQENMDSDLYRVLRSQPLSYDHAQYFTYQTLRGLKPIHDAGVLHRDIKPSNLLVNANCDLKVCDFGLARSIGAGPPNSCDHMLTEYVATRWYRAPEIMLSSRQYTKAVDIWSIGCTVYEMLCGEPLFPGKDYHHQLSLILDVLGTPSFEALRPVADGFRNYYHESHFMAPEEALVDKAHLLRLSAPEMTVLVGGMRVLGANAGGSQDGVFTHRVGVLSNDFFVNLLDMKNEWTATEHKNRFQGLDRKTRQPTWTATRVDLIFGSQSELRAQAEVYGMADGNEKFVRDFAKAWDKVMNADRMDIGKPADQFSQKLSA